MSEENDQQVSEIKFSDTVKTTSTVKTSSKKSGDEGTFTGNCPCGERIRHSPIKDGKVHCPKCDRHF